jgi:hypothetical protein
VVRFRLLVHHHRLQQQQRLLRRSLHRLLRVAAVAVVQVLLRIPLLLLCHGFLPQLSTLIHRKWCRKYVLRMLLSVP